MSTLHDLLEAAVQERLAVAQAAAEGAGSPHWRVGPAKRCECCNSVLAVGGFEVIATDDRLTEHIVANGPDRIIRDCVEDAEVLVQHPAPWCTRCREMQPCDEVLSLARRHNIPLSTKEGTT